MNSHRMAVIGAVATAMMSAALAQPSSAPAASASATVPMRATSPNSPQTEYAPGRATADSNKMGIAGPESAVDSKAPNDAACKTITAQSERDQCLAKARKSERDRTSASPVTTDKKPKP